MKRLPRILTLGLLAPMLLAGITGCDNQDPGQPPVRSISAPGHKASFATNIEAAKAKKSSARP